MKKISTLLAVSLFILTSCSSDEPGPRGPQGPPGEDGLDGLGWTFEETVTFTYYSEDGLFSTIINIPEQVTTINPDADAVLVYRLEIAESTDGGTIDTWSLIPQNFFLDEGTIQYVYNHTALDVEIIIEGNFDISTLDAGFTDNQTFRIVVVPSDFFEETAVDISNMKAVMNALDLQEADFKERNN